MKDILLEMYEIQKNMPPVTCGDYSGFIFETESGTPYIEKKFKIVLKHYNKHEIKAAERENRTPELIENCSPHSLRHSYCSFLCENDVNIKTIQEIMGHKNVSTTIDIYSEVSNSKKRKELSQIEENYISLSFKN